MGDRANITMILDKSLDEMTEEEKDNCPSIYVHWHANIDMQGGPSCCEANNLKKS